MELVFPIVFLIVGILFILLAGWMLGGNNGLWLIALMLGVIFIVVFSRMRYDEGAKTGNPAPDNLTVGARYETRCATRDNDKYITTLYHDNDFTCHRLDQPTPAVFKKTNDPKNPYQSYPR